MKVVYEMLLKYLNEEVAKGIRSSQFQHPYLAGSAVEYSEMFFGRQDIFDFILETFSGHIGKTSIVLYGARGTGKTSILFQIKNGILGSGFRPVYIDMQDMAGRSGRGFVSNVIDTVSRVF